VDLGDEGSSTGQIGNMDFSLGIEKYFAHNPRAFVSNFSVGAFIHSSTTKSTSVQGSEVANSNFEYGGMLNWHFIAPPLAYGRVIGFASMTAGIGKTTDTVAFTGGTTETEDSLEGTSSFFSLGVGAKYFTKDGFGGRAMIDYYRRTESYLIEETEDEYNKTVAGPRFMVGLAYRW
jgi:hypothetical protein